jgi:DNA polymerase III subunit epsilon
VSNRKLTLAELEFAVIDVETTGWTPDEARITEIGAVRVRAGLMIDEFTTLVNPGTPVPQTIEDLTGITSQMVADAPSAAIVLPSLLRFASGCVLTAHNAPFDLGFLIAACGDCGLAWPDFPVFDTVPVARQVLDAEEVPDCKLGTLAAFFGTPTPPCHRALADARATASVLASLIVRLGDRGVHTLDQLNAWLVVA